MYVYTHKLCKGILEDSLIHLLVSIVNCKVQSIVPILVFGATLSSTTDQHFCHINVIITDSVVKGCGLISVSGVNFSLEVNQHLHSVYVSRTCG